MCINDSVCGGKHKRQPSEQIDTNGLRTPNGTPWYSRSHTLHSPHINRKSFIENAPFPQTLIGLDTFQWTTSDEGRILCAVCRAGNCVDGIWIARWLWLGMLEHVFSGVPMMMIINIDLNIRCDAVAAKLIDSNWYWVWFLALSLFLYLSLLLRKRFSNVRLVMMVLPYSWPVLPRERQHRAVTCVSIDRLLINSNDFHALNRIFIDTLNYFEFICTATKRVLFFSMFASVARREKYKVNCIFSRYFIHMSETWCRQLNRAGFHCGLPAFSIYAIHYPQGGHSFKWICHERLNVAIRHIIWMASNSQTCHETRACHVWRNYVPLNFSRRTPFRDGFPRSHSPV